VYYYSCRCLSSIDLDGTTLQSQKNISNIQISHAPSLTFDTTSQYQYTNKQLLVIYYQPKNMKLCAACHKDLPKDKFSKKQWKLDQRRCKVCVSDNREVQPLPPSPPTKNYNESANDNVPNDSGIDNLLGSMSMNDNQMIPPSDEDLFKQPPTEDCPICFLRMPSLYTGFKYKTCCGKVICGGCIYANAKIDINKQLCPFCRTPAPYSDREIIERNKKRVEMNDPLALFNLACKYDQGTCGCPQNSNKALELWHRAGELGSSAESYHNIGNCYLHGNADIGNTCYHNGDVVERDIKKAQHYWELAAILGHVGARYNVGLYESAIDNTDRALKHFMIAARGGLSDSLTNIKELFTEGHATKDDYAKALRGYQAYLDEVKSNQRDEAAAFSDEYRYY